MLKAACRGGELSSPLYYAKARRQTDDRGHHEGGCAELKPHIRGTLWITIRKLWTIKPTHEIKQ